MQTLSHPSAQRALVSPWLFLLPILLLITLGFVSVSIGVGDFSFANLWSDSDDAAVWQLLVISRLPRTLALILSGMTLAVAGLIMQMLVRNRFVEPSTAGTIESATLGILLLTLIAPGTSVFVKMLVATAFSLGGTLVFMALLARVPLRTPYLVPLIGMILGGVVFAVTTFFAYRFDLVQSLHAWTIGDFSGVLQGRYELLWIGLLLALLACFAADRFTVVGMGEAFTTNLGLNHRALTLFGLLVVSGISATVVITSGNIPFLGLIVPNIVSLLFGDNMRKSIPWVALLGGTFVLLCDIIGRLIYYPYEIPIGTVVGVIGSILFLIILFGRRNRA